MKRYLMRGGMSPLDTYDAEKVDFNNSIGANSGNLLYAFGVYRTLLTEDCVIDMDYYGVERKYTDADIDEINQKYDAYICPLADAFRDAFAGKLLKYAHFFDRLTIPVYVIGMGLRANYGQGAVYDYPFDEEAKIFLKAVLKKSALVGLRGGITGDYLKHLGFTEDRDYKVIGCPSMYMFGREMPRRDNLILDADGRLADTTRISFNMSTKTPRNIIDFLNAQMERFPDYYCTVQNENELRLLHYGLKYKTTFDVDSSFYPLDTSNRLIQQDRLRMFINVRTWNEFMKERDLSIGSKLHGNVAALVSGCPAIFLPLDGRMQELISYHKFAAVPYEEVTEKDTVESLMEKVDLDAYVKQQPENFDRFIDFLDANGLDHIYKEDRNRKDAPVDALMDQRVYPKVESIMTCSRDEAIRRFNAKFANEKKKFNNLKKKKTVEPNAMKAVEKILDENSLLDCAKIYFRHRRNKKKNK